MSGVPSLQATLNCFHTYPHLNHTPGYVFTYMVPGGVRDLNEGLGFRRAIGFIDDQDPITAYKSLCDLNAALTYFQKPLDTHNPEWKATGLREDKEVYYYPRCPKGYPINKLHHLVFEGNAEKIEKYDELYKIHESWFDVLETGLVSKEDKAALFYEVSAQTHGNQGDFLLAWLRFQRESTKMVPYVEKRSEEEEEAEKNKVPDPEDLITVTAIDPVIYAIKAHDLIISHMPFVRGNRRLARLILCHTLVKSGIYPPMFWSGPSYDAKVTRHRFCDLKAIKDEKNETRKKTLQKLRDAEEADFIAFICALSTEAESVFQRTLPAGERPLERWEASAWRQDLKAGILQYIKSRGRVLVPDVISAISVFTKPTGKETLVCKETEKGKQDSWYWCETSTEFKEAIEKLVEDGLIRWTNAERSEYEVIRNVPTFNMNHDVDTWKAAALMAVPDKA